MVSVETITLPAAGVAGSSGPPAPRRRRRSRGLAGFLFTVPFLAGFALVFMIPFGYALVQSVFAERKSGTGLGRAVTQFVGGENFLRGASDPVFWAGVARVTVFAGVQIPVMLALSLIMALLLDAVTGRRAQAFRLALLIPYMIPVMVGALVWLYLYSPRLGPVTDLARQFGIDINFFSSGMLWLSIGNLLTWIHVGFNMLILYSSLRSVPRELFEAARIDGAGELRLAWSVKVPAVRATLVLTGMLSIIQMLQIFNEPLVFRTTSPETVSLNYTPIMMIYNQAFVANDYHYAAALSVLLAVIVGVASGVFYRLTNRGPA